MRMPPICRKRLSHAPRTRCARSRAAIPASYAEPPARTNVRLYGDENPLGAPSFESKVKLLEVDRRLCPRQGSARAAGVGLVCGVLAGGGNPARRRRELSRRAPAGARQRLGRGRRRRPAGIRQLRLWRARRLCRLPRRRQVAARGRPGGATGADQSGSGAGAGRRDGRGARSRLAGRDAARGGRPRARRRLQPQEDLRLCRPDGPARGVEGRHRGRRRHHGGAPRLALDRRRRHAHRAAPC